MDGPALLSPSLHLSEGHDLLGTLSGIQIVANSLEPVLVPLHKSPRDNVAVSGCLNFVDLLIRKAQEAGNTGY